MSSINILPTEVFHQILDYLDNFTIFFSMQNLSIRINNIVHNYNRYKAFNTLYIDCRNYSEKRAQQIIDGLRMNQTLTLVYIRGVDSLKAQDLARVLQECRGSLTTLNLRANRISDAGIQPLATTLQQNNTLITLDLGGNEIGPKGAYYLAQALRENTTLCVLNLSFNQFGSRGVQQLANTLRENQTLIKVDLQFNQVNDGDKRRVRKLLENNTRLELVL